MEIGAVKSVISELWVPNAFQVEQINVAREHINASCVQIRDTSNMNLTQTIPLSLHTVFPADKDFRVN